MEQAIHLAFVDDWEPGGTGAGSARELQFEPMREMLASIRRRARASGLDRVPVILENHTKDIRDFSHIERFVKEVSRAADIKCVTLTEIAEELRNGRFHVRSAAQK